MEAYRRPRVAAADDRDHLPVAELGATVEQGREEAAAEPAPDFRLVDIYRVFEREPIRRAQPVRSGIAVAENPPRSFGDQVRQAASKDSAPAGSEFVGVGRDLLERGQPVENMMAVNRGDLPDVSLARGTNHDTLGAHLGLRVPQAQMTRTGLPSRKATTFS